jgi:soluble lytic murein transglycosylase-like protein
MRPAFSAGTRSPLLTLAIAAALMAPAAPFVLGGHDPVVVEAGVASGDPTVAEAWRARRLEIEHRRGVERFAERYRIAPDLADQIYRAASTYEIEPGIAFGLIQTESSFRRNVVSWAGAVGYTQLLPSTARYMAPGTTRNQLFETETNLDVGFRYLRYLLDRYDGDVRLALTAYNRGPGTVNRLLRSGRNPENGYAEKVLRRGS